MRDACNALGAIGPDAMAALPTLLAVARPEGKHPDAGTALAAAVCIAPRNEEVVRLLHDAVDRASTDQAAAHAAWTALDVALNRSRERPELVEAVGIEAMVRRILVERIDPLRQVLRPHRAVADALLKERAALESGLGEPLWRDPITWSLTQATESPSWLVDALIALVKETLGPSAGPCDGRVSGELLPMPVAVVLVRICDLDPAARERVCLELRSFPQALFAIATARDKTGPHLVLVMPSMSASRWWMCSKKPRARSSP